MQGYGQVAIDNRAVPSAATAETGMQTVTSLLRSGLARISDQLYGLEERVAVLGGAVPSPADPSAKIAPSDNALGTLHDLGSQAHMLAERAELLRKRLSELV